MTGKWLTRVGDASLVASIGLGLYSLVDILRLRAALPPGACPIDVNRPRLYLALGLAIVSLILSDGLRPRGRPGGR